MDPTDVRSLKYSQIAPRLRVIYARLAQLQTKHRLSRSDEEAGAQLADEVTALDEHRRALERAEDMSRGVRGGWVATANGGHYRLEGESAGIDPYADVDVDDDHDPTRGTRDRAMRCVDGHVRSGALPARSAEVVEGMLKTGNPADQSYTARMVEALSSSSYLGAFSKLVANPAQGHLRWTAQESESFRTVEQLRSETRAMSTIDAQGGFAIPLTIDPSILISSAGSNNPLRQIARTVTTATDTWAGITSAGVTAEWIAEGLQVADASPTLASPTIPVYKADAFVPYSFEVGMDAIGFSDELAKLLTDGYNQLTATAFTTGTGIGQPTGLVTALSAGSAPFVVNTGSSGTLAATDIWNLQNQLPARFSAGAQWCSHLATMNAIRQFVTGAVLTFPSMQNDPPTLLGRNANELSNMTSALAHTSYVLLYGNFQNFVIVDRWPSSLELIPNLFGAQGRPTGQRGAFLWARVGSDVVVPNAFRLLAT
jgi:HK97 family phage major capsid protein